MPGSKTPRVESKPMLEKDETSVKERAEVAKKILTALEAKKYKSKLMVDTYSRTAKVVPLKRDVIQVLSKN